MQACTLLSDMREEGKMAELKTLADDAAKELLMAIRNRASKTGESGLLQLAQAYSLVVSAELTAELVGDDELFEADGDST
jgi:hypothetical protein